MPTLKININSIVKSYSIKNTFIKKIFLLGTIANENFDVYTKNKIIKGKDLPITLFLTKGVESKLELIEYTNSHLDFHTSLSVPDELLEEIQKIDQNHSKISMNLNTGDSYSKDRGYATLSYGDDPDGEDIIWNRDLNEDAIQSIADYSFYISRKFN